ncbi:MAG TPA: hypothetical protein VFT32_01205 [Candidatus Eisenbacteria bacterium]|nr:hypothetical protein [Candidatus Eisenbacteria bacterium]
MAPELVTRETGRTPSVPGAAAVATWALALGALLLALPYAGYLTDDSFIHFQFAKNLLRGDGFAFNAGDPTYGATSPLWVLLLALTGLAVPGAAATPAETSSMPALAWIAKGWGALFLALAVFRLVRLARRLGWEPRAALFLAALAAAHPWSARWALSGMETPLAFFAVVSALDALAAALLGSGPAWRAGAWFAVASLARPECLLLSLLAGAAVLFGSGGARLRASASLAAGFAIPYGAWLLAAWTQFHRLVPNTGGAKAGAWLDPERAASAIRDVIRGSLSGEGLPLALAIILFAFGGADRLKGMDRGRRAFWIAIAAWPLLLAAFFATTGVQVVSRYLLPATPAILLLGTASLRAIAAERRLSPRATLAALALVAGFHLGASLVLTLRVSGPSAREHTAGLRASLGEIGAWARERTPPGTLFAVADIGAFGYYSDRPVLDLFGLVTPAMGPIAVREGYDAVVANLRFEGIARPEYLVDRARAEGRLTAAPDPANPYRFLLARSIGNLGITRPGEWVYSVYSIDWAVYDRHHPRLASR